MVVVVLTTPSVHAIEHPNVLNQHNSDGSWWICAASDRASHHGGQPCTELDDLHDAALADIVTIGPYLMSAPRSAKQALYEIKREPPNSRTDRSIHQNSLRARAS